MNTIKFFKIDWIRSKSQSKFLLLFAILAVFLSVKMDTPMWSLVYLCFGAVILSATPFGLQTKSNGGFLNMLPATTLSRVSGRYLFALSMIAIAMFFGELSIYIYYIMYHDVPENIVSISCIVLAVSLITNSIQLVILYSVGNIKSQQIMAIIRMVPGFIMFFGVTYFVNYIEAHAETGLNSVGWLLNHIPVIAIVSMTIALAILFLGIWISNLIISKKDIG